MSIYVPPLIPCIMLYSYIKTCGVIKIITRSEAMLRTLEIVAQVQKIRRNWEMKIKTLTVILFSFAK